MKTLPHTHDCFVCGDSNASGLNIRFETDGQFVRARFFPKQSHVGFRQTIHGGITATLLDEIMVWACAVQTRKFSYCAELNVRYLRPIQPGMEVHAVAELTANKRNKLFEARGELMLADGTMLATSTGKYLPMSESLAQDMMSDLVGGAADFLGLGSTGPQTDPG